jgi:DNA invertase Pin-like site-specific DNA recombinase
VFGNFAALAEFEHKLIIERTKVGLASARARGSSGERKPKMTPGKLRLAQAAMRQSGTKVADVCIELGIAHQTLNRHVDPKSALRSDALKITEQKAV